MNERKLSQLQKEYRNFFLEKMRLYGVHSPAELSVEKKSEFFTEIKHGWAKYKILKDELNQKRKTKQQIIQEPPEIYERKSVKKTKEIPPTSSGKKVPITQTSYPKGTGNIQFSGENNTVQNDFPQQIRTKQIIKSEPNNEQTDDLKISFTPNSFFMQDGQYKYPVVKMPKPNSFLKLPRKGRSNQKGYTENSFYSLLKQHIIQLELANDVHMVIPNFNKPYEPDIVLYDKNINLYIDIEIDEPYDGYFRYPTHNTDSEGDIKQDDIRDLFFIESGWIVIRFSEKQIHCQSIECIDYIKNVINSIYNNVFTTEAKCTIEDQWDYNLSIQWEKIHYREKYLGISHFNKQYSNKEISIDIEEEENIENTIQRTKKFKFENYSSSIAFDEESHKYIHPKDDTGNAEYISVTTLIERFFPFDLNRYIERKALDENKTEDEVLVEYLMIRDEASERGTYLHKQIENFLKGKTYDNKLMEFSYFLNFYNNEIKKRNLLFYDAEKIIFSDKYDVAGTIDCLFKKDNKDEYVMVDWKRSKKLVIDGRPRIYGHGYALSELKHLDNSSYYKYCLQQNIYKYIIENEYHIKISSMKLVVLHENYSEYHVVNVPEMKREANIILNSLKVKI